MAAFCPSRCLLTLLAVCFSASAFSQAITFPREPSPAAAVSQTIGISTISVAYSRPSVKGREIWGALVPYGWNVQPFGAGNPAPWRSGANENTVIRFTHDVVLQGHRVPAGAYGLFFVINKDNTGEVILSKDYRSWGSFWYDPAHDEMRAPINLRASPFTEQLTYDFINISKNSAELVLNWEKMQFPVTVQFAVDSIVMTNAAEELKGPAGFSWEGYADAAGYALQHQTGYDQALTWINQAVSINRNFRTLSIKAALLKIQGQTQESDKLMQDATAMANETELNAYGYQLLQAGDADKAVAILTLNTQRHPTSANVWDSLGEAYVAKGDKKSAIQNFKKSLSLNPPPNVKANSEKYLTQLGAN